ncbi:DUF488 domain-containing protein [Vagococcus acidifermentans]|uniref:MarR family transcriptional regulator n=1 Tax=Vagococcus acidifermentans TaxID=564710 RepID=A0A430B2K4_9ENTE|nr:DUF488 family protein [Vagococcus acidifermentans]RSU14567.1 hypothetical protein CBF27_00865 [Vagococcus acidifermentans]
MEKINIKRIYDPRDPADGYRVLVDRLWPRGVAKADAALDEWAKPFTPSAFLRKKLHQQQIDWQHFDTAYRQELAANPAFPAWKESLLDKLQTQPVTLITAAKLLPANHAEVLKKVIED